MDVGGEGGVFGFVGHCYLYLGVVGWGLFIYEMGYRGLSNGNIILSTGRQLGLAMVCATI